MKRLEIPLALKRAGISVCRERERGELGSALVCPFSRGGPILGTSAHHDRSMPEHVLCDELAHRQAALDFDHVLARLALLAKWLAMPKRQHVGA